MPDLGITEALAIAGLVASAAGTGVGLYESDKTRDTQNQLAQTESAQAAQQAAQAKQRALAAAAPNAQAQTGGSLTGAGNQSFTDILAGYAGATGGSGTPNAAASAANSNAQGSSSNATQQTQGAGGPANIQELLKSLQGGGNFSGGSGQSSDLNLTNGF